MKKTMVIIGLGTLLYFLAGAKKTTGGHLKTPVPIIETERLGTNSVTLNH